MATTLKSTAGGSRVLDTRTLNRTLLRRQLLLARAELSAEQGIEHLVGLQAQAPNPPYLGLWTRLAGFALDDLSDAITGRRAVRIALQRNTIHLVTARDCLLLRPILRPVLERGLTGTFGKALAGVELAELAALGRELVEERALTFSELGKRLAETWPGHDPFALSQGVRQLVPLVQVPPRGVWGSSGQAAHTSAEHWLGAPLAAGDAPDEIVLRYLAAYGPASVRDAQTWCGLTRLNAVVARQRERLRSYRDENGVELFDLADLEPADPDTPAPVVFLPEFDNILLSHADRTRIMAPQYRAQVMTNNGLIKSTFLVDGFVAGRWRIEAKRAAATVVVEPFIRLTKAQRAELEAEALLLAAFAAPAAPSREVAFTDPR